MDCLDLPIQSLILNDLARSLATSATTASSSSSDAHPQSGPSNGSRSLAESSADELVDRVRTEAEEAAEELDGDEMLTMTTSSTHINTSFALFSSHLPLSHPRSPANLDLLLRMLADIPRTEFESGLAWAEWALPDQLTSAVVGALLKISDTPKKQRTPVEQAARERVIDGIATFISALDERAQKGDAEDVITHVLPAFNGLYRSFTSTPHSFTLPSFLLLSSSLGAFLTTSKVEHLNNLLHRPTQSSAEAIAAVKRRQNANALLGRYRSNGRPLSGNFLVCASQEMQWTMLSQVLTPSDAFKEPIHSSADPDGEDGAEASNLAWDLLLRGEVAQQPTSTSEGELVRIRETAERAMGVFEGMLADAVQLKAEVTGTDLYLFEVMSESLRLATLCSVILGEPYPTLFARIKLLLSEHSPVYESLLQESALQCLVIIVHNYPQHAQPMALHLRRFVATPLPVFDVSSDEGCTVLSATAKCLAVCIKTADGDDLVSSTMYSLLNYVTSASYQLSAQGAGYAASSRSGDARAAKASDAMTVHTMAGTVFGGGRTDEARRQVNGSAIAVVTRLALEFNQPEVTHITVSMLLQRLRGADAHTEAIIVTNLVHLALIAPRADFIDIIKSFSLISASPNPEEPRHSSAAVLAAQTRLGRELKGKTDLRDAFLIETLQMFADKGTNVQMLAVAHSGGSSASPLGVELGRSSSSKGMGKRQTEELVKDLTGQLAGLLLPLDAILNHRNFNPHHDPSPALVALFRNMWFICVVLGIPGTLTDWHVAALDRIALKTPALILESAADYVSSDLEYNSILRKEFSDVVLSKRRSALSALIPALGADIRSLSLPQVTLLQTIYEVENRRSKLGRPSYLLAYFANESLNESELAKPLGALATKIIANFRDEVWRLSLSHRLDPHLSIELQRLLVGCTHRFKRVRDVSFAYLSQLLGTFPSLMCSADMVFALLEVLTIMRNSCEEEFTDEYSPIHTHQSEKIDLRLELSDSFTVRNEITTQLYGYARTWLTSAIARAPIEVQTILQRYLSESRNVLLPDSVEMGAGLALHYSKMISSSDRQESSMPKIGGWPSDSANRLASQFAAKNYFAGEHSGLRLVLKQGLSELQQNSPSFSSQSEIAALKSQMAMASKTIEDKTSTFSIPDLRRLLFRAAAILVSSETLDNDILHHLVSIPIRAFSPRSVAAGADAWGWLVSERPSAEMALLTEVVQQWTWTIETRKGLFSTSMNTIDPFTHPVEYSPSDKTFMDKRLAAAKKLLTPHLILSQVLSSRFQAVKYQEAGLMLAFLRVIMKSAEHADHMSTHPLAREPRFVLLLFGLQMLASSHLEAVLELKVRDALYKMALAWFAVRPQWSYGSNRIQLSAEIKLLQEVLAALSADKIRAKDFVSSVHCDNGARRLPDGSTLVEHARSHSDRSHLLKILVENEIGRLAVWQNSLGESSRALPALPDRTAEPWPKLVRTAWKVSPAIAIHLAERVKLPAVTQEVTSLVRSFTKDAVDVPEALQFLLGETIQPNAKQHLQWLLLWAPVPPVVAVTYFQPRYKSHPLLLQYAMRVLEQYPVQLTFFFVPQVVQALRSDALGYVERFVFETSKVSQLFCHQIIWNMKANTHRDDGATEPDPMKPMLDKMIDRVVASLSGDARRFYDREFNFFNEVTDISGKLKPYIKKSKPEKKAKIDEEMAKIQVDAGVYLPSNPDGVVVDIDKKSGRPLQSHAKAPFMATFKVRKERVELAPAAEDTVIDDPEKRERSKTHFEVWQAAIFKVGDDCRQDVLALQIIAMFKNIFTDIGLTLYLFPYRVTATAPGCGVIDVVPNATSRDEMGRAKVNDLLSFFVDKYGGVDTVPFQQARMAFIQSMAAYSVACYILQIKDRHNGNIMIDGEGHIVHIDFGFLFDIGPGGVKFEPNSFKLNHEMVVLMGGRDSQGYRMFQELTVKAFLAIRPHVGQLVDTVRLMLESALPSFKGEGTIDRLRQRFQPHLTERKAAEFMISIIKDAHENKRSNLYDSFQLYTNGIPYAG